MSRTSQTNQGPGHEHSRDPGQTGHAWIHGRIVAESSATIALAAQAGDRRPTPRTRRQTGTACSACLA